MAMISKTTRMIYGPCQGPHLFQNWCEQRSQKYVAQTLLSVPASSMIIIVSRRECLCHTSQAIKARAASMNRKSC